MRSIDHVLSESEKRQDYQDDDHRADDIDDAIHDVTLIVGLGDQNVRSRRSIRKLANKSTRVGVRVLYRATQIDYSE
jgi:hypothetical protein